MTHPRRASPCCCCQPAPTEEKPHDGSKRAAGLRSGARGIGNGCMKAKQRSLKLAKNRARNERAFFASLKQARSLDATVAVRGGAERSSPAARLRTSPTPQQKTPAGWQQQQGLEAITQMILTSFHYQLEAQKGLLFVDNRREPHLWTDCQAFPAVPLPAGE